MFDRGKNRRKVRGGKRTSLQREVDTNFCLDLYIKGFSIREIHSKLISNLEDRGMEYQVTFQQVFNDIKAAMIDWKKENIQLVDDYISLELRKLDKMETELWDSWERSKNGKRKTEIEGGTMDNGNIRGGSLKKRTLETGDGDPRYLDLLLKIQERRAKLLGYNAPLKLELCKPEEEKPGPSYDTSNIPESLLIEIASKLQDAEFDKKQSENGNDIS